MVIKLSYYDSQGKPPRCKIIKDLVKAMNGSISIGIDMRVTAYKENRAMREKEIRLKGTLEQTASGFIFHDSDRVLPRDNLNLVDLALSPQVAKIKFFLYY